MRKELELIEQIENYLMNELNPIDKSNFEALMHADNNLKASVEFQQNLVEGIQRLGLKNDAINARKRYRLRQIFKRITLVVGILLVAATGYYFYRANTGEGGWQLFGNNPVEEVIGETIIEELPIVTLPETDTLSSESNQFLDQELFQLKTNSDTVIETENGIVMYVPENAFDTEEDAVDLVIQEALNPADILYAGLNTVTDSGDTLETGGMFYLDAFAQGERIGLTKEIIADIPADPEKTGMELYDGIEDNNGELKWTDPKPLTKPLVAVEITDLDFYPPEYEAKMEDWGYLNKGFKDSLYYSYATECFTEGSETVLGEKEMLPEEVLNSIQSTQVIDGVKTTIIENRQGDTILRDTIVSSAIPMLMFMPIPQEDETPGDVDQVITWNFDVQYTGTNEATIIMTVDQRNGWHIYSQNQPDGAIPLPTEFDYDEGKNLNQDFKLIGKTKEFGAKLADNDGFPERSFHGKTARFTQKIKILSEKSFDLTIYYGYMACLTACLPPEYRTQTLRIKGLNELEDICVDCGVNPASVKAIWNEKFNNTNLATKEFEERMPFIHQSCNNRLLELYVNNLDKNLCAVDSMAMRMLGGSLKKQFAEFARRGEGKVTVSTTAQKALNDYYITKRLAVQKAIELTKAKYDREQALAQAQLTAELDQSAAESAQRNTANKRELDQKELAFNTERVYAELGMSKPQRRTTPPINFGGTTTWPNQVNNSNSAKTEVATSTVNRRNVQPSRSFLRANIQSTGWKNVDCLMSVSKNRSNAKIKGNGRSTEISYSKMNVKVLGESNYNRVNVYVVPKTFDTYLKLNQKNGQYNYSLNDNLTYDLVVLAWSENGLFYALQGAKKGNTSISLQPTSKEKWKTKIVGSLNKINGMSEEIDYLSLEKKDYDLKNKNKAMQDLKNKARPYVFPCQCEDNGIVMDVDELTDNNPELNFVGTEEESSSNGSIGIADVEPQFPGGKNALNQFIMDNVRYPSKAQEKGDDGTVYVEFMVSNTGQLSNIRVRRGVSKELDAEALRIIQLMPNWIPGELKGQPVDVRFTIPINFRLE